MNPTKEDLLLHRIDTLSAQVAELTAMVRNGVTPPEWVSAKVLAQSLNLKDRGAEYYRYDLGVIPVDGVACRKMGKAYEYNVQRCRELIEQYWQLPTDARRVMKELGRVA